MTLKPFQIQHSQRGVHVRQHALMPQPARVLQPSMAACSGFTSIRSPLCTLCCYQSASDVVSLGVLKPHGLLLHEFTHVVLAHKYQLPKSTFLRFVRVEDTTPPLVVPYFVLFGLRFDFHIRGRIACRADHRRCWSSETEAMLSDNVTAFITSPVSSSTCTSTQRNFLESAGAV